VRQPDRPVTRGGSCGGGGGDPTPAAVEGEHKHTVCGITNCTDTDHSGTDASGHGSEITWTAWDASASASYQTSLPSTAGDYYLTDDVALSTGWHPADNTRLCLNGHVIQMTGDKGSWSNNSCGFIQVDSNVTFTLTDCDTTTTHPGYVDSSGLWHLGTTEDETATSKTITGGVITDGGGHTGGCMIIEDSNCAFVMYGGSLAGNENKGAVFVKKGTFTMHGGTITGNTNYYGAGVTVRDNGTFTMTGGSITANKAEYQGSGVYVFGGTFTMSGGSIANNTANWKGGGVYVTNDRDLAGTFTMSGGTITGNTATGSDGGGGVRVDSGTFTMSGGSIANNTATDTGEGRGGGVSVGCGTFTMNSGTITGNTAQTEGGGVYLHDDSSNPAGSFTMNGGSITGNTANNGGGVYIQVNGNNRHNTFQVSGSPTITGNTKTGGTGNNVYFSNNAIPVTFGGALTTGASIGVTMGSAGVFTSGWGTANSTTATSVFFSDNSNYVVYKNSSSELALAALSFDGSGVDRTTGYHRHSVGGTDTTFTPWSTNNALPTAAGSYVLTTDVTLTATWAPTCDITLDLNGHTVALQSGKTGSVINVTKNLTIYDCDSINRTHYGQWDSSKTTYGVYDSEENLSGAYDTLSGGLITGGSGGGIVSTGGGVYVDGGSFTVYGGTIAGNSSTLRGGGVFVTGAGTFALYGGGVVGNKSNYGGVYVDNGTFQVSGAPTVTGNTGGNVYLSTNQVVNVAGALTSGASIGVTMQSAGAFTSGWATQMGATAAPGDYFTSDNTNFVVRKNSSGEAELHAHSWGDWSETAAATCTAAGSKTRTCATCNEVETQSIPQKDHSYTYTASGAVLTETCSNGCGHQETATLSADDATYAGQAVETGKVAYSAGWQGGALSISYQDNGRAGTATASITVGGATASVRFTIASAYSGWDDWDDTPASAGAVTPEKKPEEKPADPAQSEGTAEEPAGSDGRTAADYTDVDAGQWYYEAVSYVVEQGLMQGYEDRFDPYADVSRAMLTQILYNSEGRPAAADAAAFPDVAADEWYGAAVAWAAETGVVIGYDDGTFGPDDTITREQLAAMLWRYAGSPTAQQRTLTFRDADQVDDYALEAVLWAAENGILQGRGGNLLDPRGVASRAEAAQMVMRFQNVRTAEE
jgi:hypothetical protein